VPDPLLQSLAVLGTATVYEASRADIACAPTLRAMWPGARICGRALPVRCAPRDNLPIHHAVAAARPGDVLVVDAGGVVAGYWGEVLTVAAMARGVVGLVIDGGVRDIDRMHDLGFPVFAAAPGLFSTEKRDPGTVGEPITVGGVPVATGDVVLADADGIVVVPQARAEEVVAAGRAREDKEQDFMRELIAGRTTLELLGLRPT
jgi:4-hydroxy-4-methyl-2-oxoglutarate aldolase